MICPECNGRGETIYYVETDRDENSVTVEQRKGICRTCNGSGTKPMDNADRIRAMSDEELAGFLLSFFIENMDINGIPHEEVTEADKAELLKQLQQPAEDTP